MAPQLRTTSMGRTRQNLDPKLNIDLKLDPNTCIDNGTQDRLSMMARAREIGFGQDVAVMP